MAPIWRLATTRSQDGAQVSLQESTTQRRSEPDCSRSFATSAEPLLSPLTSWLTLAPLLKMMAAIVKPPTAQTPSQWADMTRVLPPGSAEPGPWRSSRTPYVVPIAAACIDPRYKRVVPVMATQQGKTANLLNVIGHKLDTDPAPILYVGPTKSNIDGVIEPQVQQLLRQSNSLWQKTLKGRKAQKLVKRVAGVTLRLAWAGSPTELASQPAHTVLVDEVDRMQPIPGEGDPVTLAEARTATYPDGRVIITSTPTAGSVDTEIDEASGLERWRVADSKDVESAVWRFWQEGTRHEWAVPCPDCGDYFVPRFKLLKWPEGSSPAQAKREARLACPHCGSLIQESAKVAMNARGLFVAPGQRIENGKVIGDPPDSDTASFWVSGLMSPWRTFGKCASEWLTAVRSGDPETIRGKLNTVFGELYRVAADAQPWQSIREHVAAYRLREPLNEWRVLTCGVDVQKDRIIYAIRAWADGFTSWLVDFDEIWGDTSHEDVWQQLSTLLDTPIGGKRIRKMAIDSGYRPGEKWRRPDHMVYAFCRRHPAVAIATKGRDTLSKPLVASKIDVTHRGQTIKAGLTLWHVDSDHFKSWVLGRFAWPMDQRGAWFVPQDVTDDYCQQVTAEARVVKASGRATWIKVRSQNHALDCEALNVVCAYVLGLSRLTPKVTERSEPAEPATPSKPAPINPPLTFEPRRPSWAMNWRR